jgi:hypothetical protein
MHLLGLAASRQLKLAADDAVDHARRDEGLGSDPGQSDLALPFPAIPSGAGERCGDLGLFEGVSCFSGDVDTSELSPVLADSGEGARPVSSRPS